MKIKNKKQTLKGVFASGKKGTSIARHNKLERDFCPTNEFDPSVTDYHRLDFFLPCFDKSHPLRQLSAFIVVYLKLQCDLVVLPDSANAKELTGLIFKIRVKYFADSNNYKFKILTKADIRKWFLLENQNLICKTLNKFATDPDPRILEQIFKSRNSISPNELKTFVSEEEIYFFILNGMLQADLESNLFNEQTEVFKSEVANDDSAAVFELLRDLTVFI